MNERSLKFLFYNLHCKVILVLYLNLFLRWCVHTCMYGVLTVKQAAAMIQEQDFRESVFIVLKLPLANKTLSSLCRFTVVVDYTKHLFSIFLFIYINNSWGFLEIFVLSRVLTVFRSSYSEEAFLWRGKEVLGLNGENVI